MLSLRVWTVAIAAMCASGCASLREVPPPAALVSPGCRVESDDLQRRSLCAVVTRIESQSEAYRTHYVTASRTRAGVQGVTIASAIAGAGFVAFDAHLDNVKAAGLLTGAGTLINNGLSLNTRVDILRDGVASMSCYAGIGNTFIDAYSEREGESFVGRFDQVIQALGGHLVAGRAALADAASQTGADFTTARTRLNEALTAGDAVYTELMKARRAFHRIPASLDAGWREADGLLAARLVGIRPDLAALVRQAQELSQSLTAASTPPATPAPATNAARGNVRADRLAAIQQAASNILADVGDARALDTEHYVTAFEQLASCKAMAAA